MTGRLLAVLCPVLLAMPGMAAPDPIDTPRVKAKVKVRHEWAARYQDSRYGPEVTERFSRTVRIGRTGSVDLSNIAGDVTVTGGTGEEVRIEAVKRARSRNESNAKTLLDDLRIEVTELPSRVEIRTVFPRNRRNYSGSVDYTITVPSGASATIRSVSGDLRVTNVKGELRAETVSGNVVTSGATRLSLVKTVSGDIDVTDAAAEGQVTASTVSGDLTARGLKARALELGSVSGDIRLTAVTSERASVKTVSGNVEYEGPLTRNGRYEMTSHSGGVRLAVSETTGFELEATTFNGDVRSDFPLTLRAGIEERSDRRGRRLNRSIRGSFGDASAIVTLKSFSGDIVVTKR
ncbi:MAG: DUF4097 family beta strand repeat-containing protein [Vicinamibacterales bacterium]